MTRDAIAAARYITAMTPAASFPAEPDGAPRMAGLDILRGIAILSILFMNVTDMGGSLYASVEDIRHFGWGAVDWGAWWARAILLDGTARGMLEMLFGAGAVILTGRAADGWAAAGRYVRRNLLLALFGVVHIAVLLWPGDILHVYGLAALLVYPLRRLKAEGLMAIGLGMMLLQVAGGATTYHAAVVQDRLAKSAAADLAAGRTLDQAERAARSGEADDAAEAARMSARIVAEDRGRSGDARGWIATQWGVARDLQGRGVLRLWVWEAVATMLIGAALFRSGVSQGARSPHFYRWLAIGAYALGFALRGYGAWQVTRFAGGPLPGWFLGEPARLLVTIGHVALVNAALGTARGRRWLAPFGAAGRTALTLYIAQTLIGLWLLYPPFALGLYGRQGWAAQMLTALAIDAVLLVAANLYLRRFAIAPVEWAWRSLAAGRRLPFRRG